MSHHESASVSIRAPAYEDRYSAYLLYWFKSTNTDAATHLLLCMKTETGMPEQTGTQFFFLLTGTKVQILTETGLPAGAADSAAATGLNIEGLFDTGSTCIELPDSVGNVD